MTMSRTPFLVFALACAASLASAQELRLHRLFSDHMVLPRGRVTQVVGFAAPSREAQLSASWIAETVRAVAGADGRFALPLPAPAGEGPFRFEVRCGDELIAVEDVLAGDVWLASGQSNMEMTVGPSPTGPHGVDDWENETAAANMPSLRLFTVKRRASFGPESDVTGEWRVCTPESARAFSATAFFFGRNLAQRGKGPIGVVASSWGGTLCEAWTRDAGLAAFPEFATDLDRVRQLTKETTNHAERRAAFWDAVLLAKDQSASKAKKDIALPHVWSLHGLGGHDGAAFYEREVAAPAEWSGRELLVQVGPIDDMDVVLWNGTRIGGVVEMGSWNEPRQYRVPAELVREGKSTLTVCLVDASGDGGIAGSAEACRIGPVEGSMGSLSLAEGWSFRKGPNLRSLPPLPENGQSHPNSPTVLWNGMIAPLAPFPFTGAIWYQGESNRERAAQYASLFPAMIRDWRAVFGSELSFVFVQIAPYGYPNDSGQTFELRLAQEAALALPRVAMAVTTDIGDPGDIHPRQKRLVGERLAAQARKVHYGENREGLDAPRPSGARADGNILVLEFAHATSWRVEGAGAKHFEVAGDDRMFHPAIVRIDGAKLVLSSPAVSSPRYARFAHAADAMANLWNDHGLPPPPFGIEASR